MKKFKIVTKPTRVDDIKSEDWYENFTSAVELKIEKLRTKRRRLSSQHEAG